MKSIVNSREVVGGLKQGLLGVSLAVMLVAANCGSGDEGTESSLTGQGQGSAAAAAAQLFGSSENAGLRISAVTLKAEHEEGHAPEGAGDCGEGDPGCTCTSTASGDGPDLIETALFGEIGTYGSTAYPMTVGETHFCTLPDGTENEGMGPDDLGRFATFELIGTVDGTCVEADGSTTTIAMQEGSSGIWRNTAEDAEGVSYEPQVFGNFNFLINNEESVTMDCTFYLGTDESVMFADCTNEEGSVVTQDTSASCEMTAD